MLTFLFRIYKQAGWPHKGAGVFRLQFFLLPINRMFIDERHISKQFPAIKRAEGPGGMVCLVVVIEKADFIKLKVLVKKWVGKYSIIYTASKLCVAMSFTV